MHQLRHWTHLTKRNTPEGDRLDVLVALVEAWRVKTLSNGSPSVKAITYHMDQNGLQPRDLIPFIGSRNCVHEVLNPRRGLTLKMIWRLHEELGIPAEVAHQSGTGAGSLSGKGPAVRAAGKCQMKAYCLGPHPGSYGRAISFRRSLQRDNRY